MQANQIRQKFLEFFKKRGHVIIPSASLVPEHDPTTLFTGSGMQSLLPFLLGEKHPQGQRLVNSQKSFRAEDIEEVGNNRHTTFFEMLGNWSLGDPHAPDKIGAGYFKKEQLPWFFEFLTKEIGIPQKRLWITCFEGDEALALPKDTESADIWIKLGIPKERIYFYGAKENWWSRVGVPAKMPAGEPGGPDSEVFYEFDVPHDSAYGETCHPNCDCGRFLEIGNSVFMEYVKQEDGSFAHLPQRNVDFGGGLERLVAAKNNSPDIFTIDVFKGIISHLEETSGKQYEDTTHQKAFRIIADHIRSAAFIASDGVTPSNTDRGYVLRRLLRRAVYYADVLGIPQGGLVQSVDVVASAYTDAYPDIAEKGDTIKQVFADEERRFRETLERGLKEFEKVSSGGTISGKGAFILFSTYGFPVEMTAEMANKEGLRVDMEAFTEEMRKHKELSRAGAEKKFKGGLADTSEMSVKYHTATHLLHQALRDVLGAHVHQKGSNITTERLRFDFNFERKMAEEEKRRVEEIVNQKIADALPVTYEDIPLEEAEKKGAIGLFEEKYGDKVRVYKIGDTSTDSTPSTDSTGSPQAGSPQASSQQAGSGQAYSLEFCGGPHVSNTADLGGPSPRQSDGLRPREGGTFKIVKEEAVSAGVRRIKAILE